MIEIEIGSAIIRVRPDTDVAFLGAVVRLLKAPA
jgi:anaerobic selenocysteine-containing dehydrogenase